jgi:serine/threonine protein kinase
VAHAHAHNVVHRDLKPANIQVGPAGETTVIDWGLACPAGLKPRSEAEIFGTPLYMAPEQVEGEELTSRTDVYALGTLLYEILTGTHPAGPAGNVPDVLYRVRTHTPPPPSALFPSTLTLFHNGRGHPEMTRDVLDALDTIVLRCLHKDPEKRFQDAGELLAELEGLPA